MDKQMIEEMARVICGFACDYDNCDVCPFDCTNAPCEHHDYAINLINAGYRKIPEGSVVLTDEKAVRAHKMREMLDNLGVFAILEYERNEARKETAEKFAERLKEKFAYDIERCKAVDEICKELVEGM